jgi:hypothetical protein
MTRGSERECAQDLEQYRGMSRIVRLLIYKPIKSYFLELYPIFYIFVYLPQFSTFLYILGLSFLIQNIHNSLYNMTNNVGIYIAYKNSRTFFSYSLFYILNY